jgi:NADH/NAD ratio-sensing transcriptional regulator Rex
MPSDKSKGRRISLHTVERLSLYRRALEELGHDDVEFIHSHELAALIGTGGTSVPGNPPPSP